MEVDHPAIVGLVSHGIIDESTSYLALDWVEDVTLARRLGDQRRLAHMKALIASGDPSGRDAALAAGRLLGVLFGVSQVLRGAQHPRAQGRETCGRALARGLLETWVWASKAKSFATAIEWHLRRRLSRTNSPHLNAPHLLGFGRYDPAWSGTMARSSSGCDQLS